MTERISVAELCSGRVLAEQVDRGLATRGMGAGSVLDDEMVDVIRRAGVPSVLVRKLPQASGDGTEPSESTADIDLRFRHARGRPAMDTLREAVIRFRGMVDGTRC